MEFLMIGLLGGCLVLLIVLIIMQMSARRSSAARGQRQIAEEFSRNREEFSRGLNEIGRRLEQLTLKNAEQQVKMLETLTGYLDRANQSQREQTERMRLSVGDSVLKMQESNEKKLEEMRKTVDEKLSATLKERLDSSFKTVAENLESVYKSLGEMRKIAGDVNDLQRVLTNVKTRGTWAEVQLGNILEQTLTAEQYACNVSTKNDGTRVEFAIKIPSRDDKDKFILLPIDSKFPREDYDRLTEAAERADKEQVDFFANELQKHIVAQAQLISRTYINVPETTDFAIMFLPTEGLYAEVLRRPGLVDRLQNDYRVVVCGPTTITAFLNTLRIGFRTIALDQRAAEVWKVLGAAKSQYDVFETVLAKAKKKVDEASNVLDDAHKRNNIILKKLRNVESIGAEESRALLETDISAEGVGPKFSAG